MRIFFTNSCEDERSFILFPYLPETTSTTKAVWDAFQPRSCDTHSTSYSATRQTFLKLLRPGVDYREAFHKVGRRAASSGWRVAGGGVESKNKTRRALFLSDKGRYLTIILYSYVHLRHVFH